METTTTTVERDAVLVEDAHVRPMMGIEVWSRSPPGTSRTSSGPVHPRPRGDGANQPGAGEARHHPPPSGVRQPLVHPVGRREHGTHNCPGGTFERAQLGTGGLLKVCTGRGVYHAESIGADQLAEGKTGEFRSVLFWVNLARKDKQAEPTAQVVQPNELPSRIEGGAIVDPRRARFAGRARDAGADPRVELPEGGSFDAPIPAEFNAFVWMLEGEASVGDNGRNASRSQIAALGPEAD